MTSNTATILSKVRGTHSHNELLIVHLGEALEICKDEALRAKLGTCLRMVEGLEDYLEVQCPAETPLQKKLFDDTMAEPWAENFKKGITTYSVSTIMLSGNHEAQFLKMMAEICNAEKILEIGMFTGYSAAAFSAAECVKQVTTLEMEPYLVNFVKSRVEGTIDGQKIRVKEGPALASLEELKKSGETFDLVFIDADKLNYINYYKFVMDNNLIGSGGVILMDNTLWKAQLYPEPHGERGQISWDLNEFIRKDDRVSQVILQIRDGVSLIRRK